MVNLRAEKNDLLYAVPGGLIGIYFCIKVLGVGLTLDPSITRNDRLIRNDKLMGNVLGFPGCLPDIYTEL